MSEIEKLKKENKLLKEKLKSAEIWMKRSVKEEVKKISKRKIKKFTCKTRDNFMQENIDEVITTRINKYFGEFILMNTPSSIIENIISAEINYYNLRQNPGADGMAIVTSYHKALDAIIERNITKGFRKYSKKIGQIHLRKNDTLEKSLHSVVNKGYILSIGRLFHIIKIINEEEQMHDYTKAFKSYLDKYENISKVLFDEKFFEVFSEITKSEVFGKKRHEGNINFVETRDVRNLLIGDFKDKNSLVYKLAKISEIYY